MQPHYRLWFTDMARDMLFAPSDTYDCSEYAHFGESFIEAVMKNLKFSKIEQD